MVDNFKTYPAALIEACLATKPRPGFYDSIDDRVECFFWNILRHAYVFRTNNMRIPLDTALSLYVQVLPCNKEVQVFSFEVMRT